MSLSTERKSMGDVDAETIENIITAISSSVPAKTRRDQEVFSKLFPALREALEQRGVTRKELLLVLGSKGIKISTARFKSLYEDEVKRQSEQPERRDGI